MTKTVFRSLAAASLAAILITGLRTGWGDDVPRAPVTFPGDAPALEDGALRCRVAVEPVGLGERARVLVELENRGQQALAVRKALLVTHQGASPISRVPVAPVPVEVQRLPLQAELAPGETKVVELRLDAGLTGPDRLFFSEYSLSVVPVEAEPSPVRELQGHTLANASEWGTSGNASARIDLRALASRRGGKLAFAPAHPVLARFALDPERVLGVTAELQRRDGRVVGAVVKVRNPTRLKLDRVRVDAVGLAGLTVAPVDARAVQEGLLIEPGVAAQLVYRVDAAPADGKLMFNVSYRGLVRQVDVPLQATK